MKLRKGLITLTVAGLMAVLLCLPGPVAGGGNPPIVLPGEKLTGKSKIATVIMGWRDTGTIGDNMGIVDAFIRVDDKLYMVRDESVTVTQFLLRFRPGDPAACAPDPCPWNIPLGLVWLSDRIPGEIPGDFGISGVKPVIWEERDVLDYEFQCLDSDDTPGSDCDPGGDCPMDGVTFLDGVVCAEHSGLGGFVFDEDYQYIMHATVKLSFIVPPKK
jgi:hypothetical protein